MANTLIGNIMQENAVYFASNLLVTDLFLNCLLQSGTLTQPMLDEVEVETTTARKLSTLRTIITRRGPASPAFFLEALLVSGQKFVVEEVLRVRERHQAHGANDLLLLVEAHCNQKIVDQLVDMRERYPGAGLR